jgi:hypothetical protein
MPSIIQIPNKAMHPIENRLAETNRANMPPTSAMGMTFGPSTTAIAEENLTHSYAAIISKPNPRWRPAHRPTRRDGFPQRPNLLGNSARRL